MIHPGVPEAPVAWLRDPKRDGEHGEALRKFDPIIYMHVVSIILYIYIYIYICIHVYIYMCVYIHI